MADWCGNVMGDAERSEVPTSVEDLLAAYASAMAGLRERGVTRSANSPIADFAEHLAGWHYTGKLEAQSTSGFDVLGSDGVRVQVKALWHLGKSRTSLSALRGLEQRSFDLLLAVVFAADLRSWEGFELDYELVVEKSRWSSTWSAHRLSISKQLVTDPRVRRITLEAPPESYWLDQAPLV
jgi:hypothetical protein